MNLLNKLAERTENDDYRGAVYSTARPIYAAVRTTDASNVVVVCCVFQPRRNVALLRSHGNSLENVWRIGAARRIDFGVAVVDPGNFTVFVAHASHVGIFVLTANDQSVLWPDDNGTEHA